MKIANLSFLLPSLMIGFISQASIGAEVQNTNMAGAIIPHQTTAIAKNEKKMLVDLFTWINQLSDQTEMLSAEKVGTYFNTNVSYEINGKLLASNLEEITDRFSTLLAKNKEMHVVMPLDSIIIANNQAAITYQVKITNDSGKSYLDHISAFINFENGKIKSWQAIAAHE